MRHALSMLMDSVDRDHARLGRCRPAGQDACVAPCQDEMLMIRPVLPRAHAGDHRVAAVEQAVRLMLTTSSQPSSDIDFEIALGPPMLVPALVTVCRCAVALLDIAAVSLTAFLSATSSRVLSIAKGFKLLSASRVVFSVLPETTTRAPALTSSMAPAGRCPTRRP